MTYDSTEDTKAHIQRVQFFLGRVYRELVTRARRHDQSKLREPEKSMYDEFTPKLKAMTYGSAEYKATLEAMGSALWNHYAFNDHHPEHHERGVIDMDMLQLIEMLADWKAATERVADGDLAASIDHNKERFGMSNELTALLHRTADHLGWL